MMAHFFLNTILISLSWSILFKTKIKFLTISVKMSLKNFFLSIKFKLNGKELQKIHRIHLQMKDKGKNIFKKSIGKSHFHCFTIKQCTLSFVFIWLQYRGLCFTLLFINYFNTQMSFFITIVVISKCIF